MTVRPHFDGAQPLPGFAVPRGLKAIADDLGYSPDWNWSWENYKPMILALAREHGLRQHLEIGGGRDPVFSPAELAEHRIAVTINDLSQRELDLAPPGFAKLCCDIAATDTVLATGRERFDFAYCRMVMEHVPDVTQMWRNVHALLTPGGVALSFFPTLFAPPFAANQIMPEHLSRAVLHRLFPDRSDDGDNPKFPAHYNLCRGSETVIAPVLREIGFREVVVLPFYGYSYFWKIPGLKQVDAAFTRLARARDWRTFTSFAYVIARK
ncbi:class I SAM-dependent methyltransferase [Methylobacterium sp. Leaf118]|uniref:class I SAM-dependent methyltransferase n=1 Tax=Methylobacterium sp. Leaf118 TaxID=2876562 RepID=UPI001E4B7133|nr:methyltransferase domain-containing protein [Methylobacterium sp. Leaf118]